MQPAAEVAQAQVSLAALHVERPHAAARRTIGAGRSYALPGDVATAQALGFTPHVARWPSRPVLDGWVV